MKTIEVDDQLYSYIASQTEHIGESASDILRRLLNVPKPEAQGGENTTSPSHEADRHPPFDELVRLLNSKAFASEGKVIGRFMAILATLYQLDSAGFTAATEIKGTKRVYFGRSQEQLLEHGSSTKPRQIPDTPYWVITNTNTGRKRNIIAQLMADMGFCQQQIEQICQAI